MTVYGLDPGYRDSALVAYNGRVILHHGIFKNEDLLTMLAADTTTPAPVLVLEEMQIFAGHGVGKEIFDSVFWSGRFAERWAPRPFERLLRAKVRAHLGASKGGDAAVRQALIEKFGPYREDAIGKRSRPGPLFGITSHCWSALAIAVTWAETRSAQARQSA